MKRFADLFSLPALLFIVVLLLISSCTAKKKLVSPLAHAADYEWMAAKMNGTVNIDRGEFPFTGMIRMRRDSMVWISATTMGMEAVRARISCDSVIVINRLDKTYLAEPIEEVASSLQVPLTLQLAQVTMLGDGKSSQIALSVGPYTAKVQYTDIHWNEPTTFPIKISSNYERMKL